MSNNDFRTPLGDSDHENDRSFDLWLSGADPLQDHCLDDATKRLQSTWDQLRTDKRTPDDRSQLNHSPIRVLASQRSLVSLAIAVCMLICVVYGSWWLAGEHSRTADVPRLDKSQPDNHDALPKKLDPSYQPDVTMETAKKRPESNTHKSNKSTVRRNEILIVTVQHLRRELEDRQWNQRYPILHLDEKALQAELGQWLSDWSNASPDRRQKLAGEWKEYRGYWLPWARRWCGSWKNNEQNIAALQVIATDEGYASVPFLLLHLENQSLRSDAWSNICRVGKTDQLANLLPQAVNCDEVQALAVALIKEGNAHSTDLLLGMSADPKCREAMKGLQVDWPDQHARYCWTLLTGQNKDLHAPAASLLAIIPSTKIDHWLSEELRLGRNQVCAVSVLLLRDTPVARRVLTKVRTNQALAGNLPSSQQQVVRWSLFVSPSPFLSRKVCEKCLVQS